MNPIKVRRVRIPCSRRALHMLAAALLAVMLPVGLLTFHRVGFAPAAAVLGLDGGTGAAENSGPPGTRAGMPGDRAGSAREIYIVIDRVNNRISLRRRDQVLLEAPCSTGSGGILVDEAGGRRWEFVTPRGEFRVLSKLQNPVWRKPDWAFVEEGEAVPADPADRLEYGVLGEYGLYFGDGYLIHGTLYERLLGRSVSHGCVRVGRDALRVIYESAPVGTRIYVY